MKDSGKRERGYKANFLEGTTLLTNATWEVITVIIVYSDQGGKGSSWLRWIQSLLLKIMDRGRNPEGIQKQQKLRQ